MIVWILYEHHKHRTWVRNVFATRADLVAWLEVEAKLSGANLKLSPGQGWWMGAHHFSLDPWPVFGVE